MNLTIEGIKYKFSFLRPQNTIHYSDSEIVEALKVSTNLKEGRKAGKEWKKLLLG